MLPSRHRHGVAQEQGADTLADLRRVDVDGDDRPGRRLAKTDQASPPVGYEERPSLNGIEIPIRRPIQQPGIDHVR